MTTGVRILENDGRLQITASGGQTSLAFDFPIYDESHIRIIRTRSGTDTTLVLTTDYTVPSGSVGVEAGGVVTLNSGATAGDIYTLLLAVPYARTSDFIVAGDFRAETLNLELDLLTQQNQQIVRDQSYALRLPDSTTLTGVILPAPEASKLIGWDSGATGLSNYALADLSSSVVSSYAQTLLDDTTSAAARTTLGLGSLATLSSVANADMATMAANTVKANATSGSASPTDVALTANTFLGRSSAGNIAAKAMSDDAFAFNAAANNAAMRTALGVDVNLIKAWVNFNGTGTVAIRASFNVSSITDNGVGDYTINFNTALSDANYAVIGTCGDQPSSASPRAVMTSNASAPTTSACRICTTVAGTGAEDQSRISVQFLR